MNFHTEIRGKTIFAITFWKIQTTYRILSIISFDDVFELFNLLGVSISLSRRNSFSFLSDIMLFAILKIFSWFSISKIILNWRIRVSKIGFYQLYLKRTLYNLPLQSNTETERIFVMRGSRLVLVKVVLLQWRRA